MALAQLCSGQKSSRPGSWFWPWLRLRLRDSNFETLGLWLTAQCERVNLPAWDSAMIPQNVKAKAHCHRIRRTCGFGPVFLCFVILFWYYGFIWLHCDIARVDLTLGWIIVFNSAPDRPANRNPPGWVY
ncbi:hypothetical protein M5D96_001969 [Drosophila gunungcola]|uniref:Uncharacterized protein n=1 Tax=Drosophila gunungcola TaxID=103775 RepID=A0A9P9YZG9_9MUSC|nr:hypothetical protein M5D96_001969 [Drosophila gunungcola]